MTSTEDKYLQIQNYLLGIGAINGSVFELRGYKRFSVFMNGCFCLATVKAGFQI